MQRSDFTHIVDQQIRWGDMDALGHVNNIMFFRFFESGRIAYVDDLIPGENLNASTVLADIQCSFLHQLHYPGTVEVGTRVSRLGNRSVELSCALFNKNETGAAAPAAAAAAATARAVLVWFDFDAQRSIVLPERLRRAIVAREKIPPQEK